MKQELIINICCSLLIVLFLYTGLTKLYSHLSFEITLKTSPLLSSFSEVIAWGLPVTEIAVALLLAFKETRLTGLYVSAILLSCFTVYIIYMVTNYSKLPCHCGGVISKMSWRQHIPFNLFFLLIAIIGITLIKQFKNRIPAAI